VGWPRFPLAVETFRRACCPEPFARRRNRVL